MRTTICEVCGRTIPLTSDLLAAAALDLTAKMACPCGAILEAVYIDHKLLTATAHRVIRFGASGPVMFTRSAYLEGR
jgi:hypothetical protein